MPLWQQRRLCITACKLLYARICLKKTGEAERGDRKTAARGQVLLRREVWSNHQICVLNALAAASRSAKTTPLSLLLSENCSWKSNKGTNFYFPVLGSAERTLKLFVHRWKTF